MISKKLLALLFRLFVFIALAAIFSACRARPPAPPATPAVIDQPTTAPSPEPTPEPSPEPTLAPTPEPTSAPAPISYPCPPQQEEEITTSIWHFGEPADGIMADQVILTGKPDDINEIVRQSPVFTPNQQPILEISLPGADRRGYPVVIRLYEFPPGIQEIVPGITAWGAVARINEQVIDLADQAGLAEIDPQVNTFVVAEPNYTTIQPVAAHAHGGSSHIVGGGGGPGSTAPEDLFASQWAFGAGGINLDAVAYTGAGVEVAVFDSTPLPQGAHPVAWARNPFTLCVWRPGLMYGTSSPGVVGPMGAPVSPQEHGLFVTGLAQGVAPNAHYNLIEVLDEQAKGDIGTLLRAMDVYVQARQAAVLSAHGSGAATLRDTVINLSLGLDLEDQDQEPDAEASAALADLQLLLARIALDYTQTLANRIAVGDSHLYPVLALQAAVDSYHQEGAVIVAASGNDQHNQAHIPAVYEQVIAVAASNQANAGSCFTNPGSLGAPGGDLVDTGGGCNLDLSAACASSASGVCGSSAVVSLVTKPSPSDSGYAYWTGTSMSAPLVSGLATLIQEARPGLPPAETEKVIHCSASPTNSFTPLPAPAPALPARLGAGVIDVHKALTECLP